MRSRGDVARAGLPVHASAGGRRRIVVMAALAVAVVVALVVAVVLIVVDPYAGGSVNGDGVDNAAATATATVVSRSISSQTNVSATLGYAGSYQITTRVAGTITWLPPVGGVIAPGQPLFVVDGDPVVLLAGSTPAFRVLVQGETGPDVAQLNADLVALGDATSAVLNPASDVFGLATATAVRKLQVRVGADPTGVLGAGQVVFLPTAARITAVRAGAGETLGPGAQVLTATSTTRQVVVALDAAQQAAVKAGDSVSIILPDNSTTAGVVSTVGTVATIASGSGSAGGGAAPTVEVDITPTDPGTTGTFDQAPVQVAITTATVSDALVVPVAALIAPAGGGYALEVIEADHSHRFEAVRLGIFDDAHGLVQVSGPGVAAGQQVVVPAS
jgi:Putative peptidoglycan binding domain